MKPTLTLISLIFLLTSCGTVYESYRPWKEEQGAEHIPTESTTLEKGDILFRKLTYRTTDKLTANGRVEYDNGQGLAYLFESGTDVFPDKVVEYKGGRYYSIDLGQATSPYFKTTDPYLLLVGMNGKPIYLALHGYNYWTKDSTIKSTIEIPSSNGFDVRKGESVPIEETIRDYVFRGVRNNGDLLFEVLQYPDPARYAPIYIEVSPQGGIFELDGHGFELVSLAPGGAIVCRGM